MFGESLDCNPEYLDISNQINYRTLRWLEQVDLNPSLLFISLYWLKEKTQTSKFVLPWTESSDSALYFNKKNKPWIIYKSIFEAYFSIIIYLSIYYP